MSFGLLPVFHVRLVSPHWLSNWTLYFNHHCLKFNLLNRKRQKNSSLKINISLVSNHRQGIFSKMSLLTYQKTHICDCVFFYHNSGHYKNQWMLFVCLNTFRLVIFSKNSEVIHKNLKKFTIRPNYFYKHFLY